MRLIIKAEILYKEGGVWIDPEIVVERMNWLTSSTCAILEFTLSDGREHQILATAKNHPFITSWYNLIKNSNSVEYVEELINTIGKDYKSGIKFDSREDYLRYFGLVAGRIALEKNLQDVGVYVVEYPTLNLNGKEYVPTNRVVTSKKREINFF